MNRYWLAAMAMVAILAGALPLATGAGPASPTLPAAPAARQAPAPVALPQLPAKLLLLARRPAAVINDPETPQPPEAPKPDLSLHLVAYADLGTGQLATFGTDTGRFIRLRSGERTPDGRFTFLRVERSTPTRLLKPVALFEDAQRALHEVHADPPSPSL